MTAIDVTQERGETVVHVRGRLDFRQQLHLRDATFMAVKQAAQGRKHLVLDLSETDGIESSGLGRLLLLREAVGGEMADIDLVNPTPEVREALEMAHFERFFHIA